MIYTSLSCEKKGLKISEKDRDGVLESEIDQRKKRGVGRMQKRVGVA